MGCISTIDLQTKMDVHELLSRFCYFLDHDKKLEWVRLFTPDAAIEMGPIGTFAGHAEIATVPGKVAERGNGMWRCVLTNIMFERTANLRELVVNACCMITDWSGRGVLAHCADFKATLQHRRYWQIDHLTMTPVGPVHFESGHISNDTSQIEPTLTH